MRTEKAARPSRLLRVRDLTDTVSKKPTKRAAKSGKSRFVAPNCFAPEVHSAIEDCLARAGVGDADGRRLFITAAEYEMASYQASKAERPSAMPQPTPRPRSPAQDELESLGRHLHALLKALGETRVGARKILDRRLTESDRFGRPHDERYFEALKSELARMEAACALEGAHEPDAPATPRVSEETGALLGQLSRIYRECLEVRLQGDALATFHRVLELIGDATQVEFPSQAGVLGLLLETS
jgi:hypothetical protein